MKNTMVLWLAAVSVLMAVQLTVLLQRILTAYPAPSPLKSTVLAEWQDLLKPEWETVLFRFFVLAALTMMVSIGWYVRRKHKGDIVNQQMQWFIAVEAVLTFIILSAAFKAVVYAPRSDLALRVLMVALCAAFLNKVGWPWIFRALIAAADFLTNTRNARRLSIVGAFLFPVVLFLIMDVPNAQGVVARFFIGEQFHHNDSFIFGGAWAFASGCRLDLDIISQYGVGLGVVFGALGKFFGGLTYETGFCIRLYAAIAYYILFFIFLRRWLSSTAIAAAAILFLIKIQMFHSGVFPFPFTYASATVIRYWFDVVFFFSLAAHLHQPLRRYLIIAAASCGVQLFYIPSEGVYLMTAFYFYLVLNLCIPSWRTDMGYTLRRLPFWILLAVLPVLVAFALMLLSFGPGVISKTYWLNLNEFVNYFLSGFGVTPIYSSLQERKFLANLMGYVLPAVYVLTLIGVGALLLLKRIHRKHMLVCVFCVYGLSLYHYYVARSTETSYYVTSMPYVMVLAFWAKAVLGLLPDRSRRNMKLILLTVCAWALWTNHNFIAYPNRINFSRNPLTDPLVAQPLKDGKPYFNHLFRDYLPTLKVPVNNLGSSDEGLLSEADFASDDDLLAYYRQAADFSADAQLITRLTAPDEPVPLISSFEIQLLMQAKRKPYFYYFPLAISRPMTARSLPRSSIYTTDQLNKVIQGLERDKPPYIFMERVLLTRPLGEEFYFYYSSMILLTDYVIKQYVPVAQGQYLVALKRRTND